MPFIVNDLISASEAPLNIIGAINALASQIKLITGQSSWKITPTVSLLGEPISPPRTAISTNPHTIGNQQYNEAISLYFVPSIPIKITHLGAFDSEGNGFSEVVGAELWDATNMINLATRIFSGNEGVLVGGFRFVPLSPNIILSPGSTYAIVGRGFDAQDPDGNVTVASPPTIYTDTEGAIQFTEARFSGSTTGDELDAIQGVNYLAASFMYTTY